MQISGYASLFHQFDLSGDRVQPGAFRGSLLKRPTVPMLFDHDPAKVVGMWSEIREDDKGLFVQGILFQKTDFDRSVTGLVERGAVDGLSIGFRTQRSKRLVPKGRWLLEIDLWEISIVPFPMLAAARLTVSASSRSAVA